MPVTRWPPFECGLTSNEWGFETPAVNISVENTEKRNVKSPKVRGASPASCPAGRRRSWWGWSWWRWPATRSSCLWAGWRSSWWWVWRRWWWPAWSPAQPAALSRPEAHTVHCNTRTADTGNARGSQWRSLDTLESKCSTVSCSPTQKSLYDFRAREASILKKEQFYISRLAVSTRLESLC